MCEACGQLADHYVCLLKDLDSCWTICIRCYRDETWATVIRIREHLAKKEQADTHAQDPWKELGI
jgi:hypothetical protein